MKTLEDFAKEQARSEVTRQRLAAVVDHGHELVALMQPGDDVFCSGQWRMVKTITPASGGRIHLVMADGSEFVALPGATRRHRRLEQVR